VYEIVFVYLYMKHHLETYTTFKRGYDPLTRIGLWFCQLQCLRFNEINFTMFVIRRTTCTYMFIYCLFKVDAKNFVFMELKAISVGGIVFLSVATSNDVWYKS